MSATGFVTPTTTDAGTPHKITNVQEVSTFLTAYVDGSGKKQTRLCFRAPDSEQVFILNEQIQGKFVATTAHSWFNKEFARQVDVSPEGADQV